MDSTTQAIDSKAFRQTVGQFVTGVTIIATDRGGEVHAMTANSFSSLSLDPPLVLFCPGKSTKAGQIIHDASAFSVNILQQSQRDQSTYFAGGWKGADAPPFSFKTWHGTPLLEGSAAALACRLHAIHEGGDHWIVVGRVVAIYRNDVQAQPLVFFGGRYALLETPPEAAR